MFEELFKNTKNSRSISKQHGLLYARGLAVMMGASQALDPGSTPGGRTTKFLFGKRDSSYCSEPLFIYDIA